MIGRLLHDLLLRWDRHPASPCGNCRGADGLRAGSPTSLLMTIRLNLAWRMDQWVARWQRLGEKLGYPQAWLHEFAAYLDDARLLLEEFWVRYTLKRMAAQDALARVANEHDALAFYRQSDYILWRQVVHRRHSQWRTVLATMRGPTGLLLEFGCGIAPVSAWVQRRRPHWLLCLTDVLDSPHFTYARHRITRHGYVPMGREHGMTFAVITVLDVLEHLPDPESAARELVARLAPGGYLHWNFVDSDSRHDLDLATPAQRDATVKYLRDALETVWECPQQIVGRKRC